MTPFRWTNCHADVAAARHDLTIRVFYTDVILPAITALEARILELENRAEPVADFERSDMQDLLAETKLAFSLAVQSVWERQLRAYLIGCATELRPGQGVEGEVKKADWPRLNRLFGELRGILIEDFPSYAELDLLHHLGNACRHGDGTSAQELAARCPDWWPESLRIAPEVSSPSTELGIKAMTVPANRIAGFVEAIARFWTDHAYIYNESIEQKHPTLEAKLTRERVERSWRPQMRP